MVPERGTVGLLTKNVGGSFLTSDSYSVSDKFGEMDSWKLIVIVVTGKECINQNTNDESTV